MCINLYTLPKRSIAMLSWNVLTTSRQLLVTQLRFRYMFLSASWEHLDSFVKLLLTILDELFLVLNMFHEFSKVHGPSDRSRIVKKCQVVSRIGYRSRQEVSRHTIRHTSCSNSYSGTGPLEKSNKIYTFYDLIECLHILVLIGKVSMVKIHKFSTLGRVISILFLMNSSTIMISLISIIANLFLPFVMQHWNWYR